MVHHLRYLLIFLQDHKTVAMVAEEKHTTPPEVFPVFAQDDGNIVVLFRGDAGYESGDGSEPGARHRALLEGERWIYVHEGVDDDYPAFIRS